ncbi:DsbA family protein [Rhizobium sp. PAMB 3182]
MTLIRKTLAALSMTALIVAQTPARAEMSDEQKQEFGAFIKQYLIENPEILIDVQKALQDKQEQAQVAAAQQAIEKDKNEIFASKSDLVLGNPTGDVTVVEFFDYNCGYCRRALPDMTDILKEDKNVRFVLKELPILGPDSTAAHKVADAFRQIAPEKYGEFHLKLLGGKGRATAETATALAVSLGVSKEQIEKTIKDFPNDKLVDQNIELAQNLGVSGTPSYVIGDEAIYGAVGKDTLEEKIANVRACGKATC